MNQYVVEIERAYSSISKVDDEVHYIQSAKDHAEAVMLATSRLHPDEIKSVRCLKIQYIHEA